MINKKELAAQVIRKLGMSDVTYYRWPKEYGGKQRRPHSSIGYHSPAPKSILPVYGSQVLL